MRWDRAARRWPGQASGCGFRAPVHRELTGAGLQVALREQRSDGGRVVGIVQLLVRAQAFVLKG